MKSTVDLLICKAFIVETRWFHSRYMPTVMNIFKYLFSKRSLHDQILT